VNGVVPNRPLVLSDLRTWVLAYVDTTQGYVGHPRDDTGDGRVRLQRPYTFVGSYKLSPQGVGRDLVLFPVELMVGIDLLEVWPRALLRLGELAQGDFNELGGAILQGITNADAMREAVRTRRSGIMLAPPSLKLPDLKVRG
jgi:hypothetical protein